MNKTRDKERIITNIIIFLLIFVLTLVYSKTHLEHDSIYDFRMRYPKLTTLDVVLNYGNGRIFGNLFGIIFIPHPVIMSLIKALITLLILDFTIQYFDFKGIYKYCFLFAVALMTKDFWFQMFFYSSSFFNYIPPLLFLLLALRIIKNVDKISYAWIIVIALCGFVGQFFIEHIALMIVFIAFCFCIYYFKRNRAKFLLSFGWFVSSGIGLFTMFFFSRLFVVEPLEGCHQFANSLSTLLFNMGQMLVAVFLGNIVLGFVAAIVYAQYECLTRPSKDISASGAVICLMIFLSSVGGEGTLLFSPIAIYLLHRKYEIIQKDKYRYFFLYIIIYISTFMFLFVDFRGESMCLQFSNYCESVLWILILQHNNCLQIKNSIENKNKLQGR